jgi:hypothetical protein
MSLRQGQATSSPGTAGVLARIWGDWSIAEECIVSRQLAGCALGDERVPKRETDTAWDLIAARDSGDPAVFGPERAQHINPGREPWVEAPYSSSRIPRVASPSACIHTGSTPMVFIRMLEQVARLFVVQASACGFPGMIREGYNALGRQTVCSVTCVKTVSTDREPISVQARSLAAIPERPLQATPPFAQAGRRCCRGAWRLRRSW